MWAMIGSGLKYVGQAGGWVVKGASAIAGVAGLGAVADSTLNEGRLTQRIVGDVGRAYGTGQGTGALETGFFNFGKMIEMIARFLEKAFGRSNLTEGMMRFSASMQDKDRNDLKDSGAPGRSTDFKTDIKTAASELTGDPKVTTAVNAADQRGDLAGLATGAVGLGVAIAVGGRAIPIFGAAYAAGDGIVDAVGYGLQGEWKKAGLRVVSTVPDVMGSSLGFLGMAFGAAGREAVEAGGEKLLGENAHLPDSRLASGAKWVGQRLGITGS